MAKYGNKKMVVDGILFDSKLEANRYCVLRMMEKGGLISDLVLQPEFTLIPSFRKNGKTYRATKYIADFMYNDLQTQNLIVEDVKGFRTDVFKLKKKLFEWRYPDLEVREVQTE